MNTNILDFGAVADAKTLCSANIQAAIDKCAETGGGRVTVPAGTFVCGTIWFRDNVELHLEHGATIKASGCMDDYHPEDAYPQNKTNPESEKWVGRHLMVALECKNVALTGTGTIDGSGDLYFDEPKEHSRYCWTNGLALSRDLVNYRPGPSVCFIECEHVHVENVTLKNITSWGILCHGCDFVTINGIKIYNPITYANTDGIDIDSSSRVVITNCIIDTGDDAIAIRGDGIRLKQSDKACEFVTVSNCVLGSSSSVFRIGVGFGAIRHVNVSNIVMMRGSCGMTFMSDYLGKGHVDMEDINFRAISAIELAYPFQIFEGSEANIKNINIENFRAEICAQALIRAVHKGVVENVTLKNIEWKLTNAIPPRNEKELDKRGHYVFEAKNVTNLCLDNVSITADPEILELWDDVLKIDRCPSLKLNQVKLP